MPGLVFLPQYAGKRIRWIYLSQYNGQKIPPCRRIKKSHWPGGRPFGVRRAFIRVLSDNSGLLHEGGGFLLHVPA